MKVFFRLDGGRGSIEISSRTELNKKILAKLQDLGAALQTLLNTQEGKHFTSEAIQSDDQTKILAFSFSSPLPQTKLEQDVISILATFSIVEPYQETDEEACIQQIQDKINIIDGILSGKSSVADGIIALQNLQTQKPSPAKTKSSDQLVQRKLLEKQSIQRADASFNLDKSLSEILELCGTYISQQEKNKPRENELQPVGSCVPPNPQQVTVQKIQQTIQDKSLSIEQKVGELQTIVKAAKVGNSCSLFNSIIQKLTNLFKYMGLYNPKTAATPASIVAATRNAARIWTQSQPQEKNKAQTKEIAATAA